MLELARSRVAQDQLSRVESGKVAPTLEILLRVATKFGIIKGLGGKVAELPVAHLKIRYRATGLNAARFPTSHTPPAATDGVFVL